MPFFSSFNQTSSTKAAKQYCQYVMDNNLRFFIDWIVMLSCELHCRNNALWYTDVKKKNVSFFFLFFFSSGEWISQKPYHYMRKLKIPLNEDDDDDEALSVWSNAHASVKAAIKNTYTCHHTSNYDTEINNSIFEWKIY